MQKFCIVIFLSFISTQVFSQEANIITNHNKEKFMETEWGTNNKHFGYYHIRYLVQTPYSSDYEIENALKSGIFSIGYTYRYKLMHRWDLGTEVAYESQKSNIDNQHYLFEQFSYDYDYDKIYTYERRLNLVFFNRINIKDGGIRNLGTFVDLGVFYNLPVSTGIDKSLNNEDIKVQVRQKSPYFLNDDDYGVFFRFGKNYWSFYARYSFSDTFIQLNDNYYKRTPLSLGLQFNIYAR